MPIRTYSFKFPWLLCVVAAALLTECTPTRAQPIVEWATVGGSTGDDYLHDVALALGREIYLAGDFDAWTGTVETVLYKFDLSGRQIGSQATRGERINAVAVDPNGNYYLTGRVWDAERLGAGRTNDFYLAKYAADGTLLWERTAGTSRTLRTLQTDGQPGNRIALDAAGNIYVAGASTGPAVFGNVTFPPTPGGPMLCKYDPDGTLLWVKRAEGTRLIVFGNPTNGGEARSMAFDPEGNIVIGGTLFDGKADFGGTVVTMDGYFDYGDFTAKYNPAGEVLWVSTSAAVGAVDRRGNIYASTGHFDSTGAVTGLYKYDPSGNLIWERTVLGVSLASMAMDGKDEPIFFGSFTGTVQLDDYVVQDDSSSQADILICKADASGKFQWAFAGSTSGLESFARHVVCDRAGTIYVAGIVQCGWSDGVQVCDGASMLGSFPIGLQIGGSSDFFVARLTDPTAVAVELRIAGTASGLALSWPAALIGFVLESATALPATNWSTVPGTPSLGGDQNVVTVEIGSSQKFFRLRKP